MRLVRWRRLIIQAFPGALTAFRFNVVAGRSYTLTTVSGLPSGVCWYGVVLCFHEGRPHATPPPHARANWANTSELANHSTILGLVAIANFFPSIFTFLQKKQAKRLSGLLIIPLFLLSPLPQNNDHPSSCNQCGGVDRLSDTILQS